MAIKKLALLIPFLLVGNAWANVEMHCPKVEDFIEPGGVGTYKAKGPSGEYEWFGVTNTGSGPVQRFESAFFEPVGDAVDGVVVGKLSKCGYHLKNGQVDMKLEREVPVSIQTSDEVWESYYDAFYFCYATSGTECKFKRLSPKAKG